MNLHDLNPSTRNWAGGNTAEWYVNLRPGYDAWTAPNNVVGHDAHWIVARLERAWGLLRMAHLENEGFALTVTPREWRALMLEYDYAFDFRRDGDRMRFRGMNVVVV